MKKCSEKLGKSRKIKNQYEYAVTVKCSNSITEDKTKRNKCRRPQKSTVGCTIIGNNGFMTKCRKHASTEPNYRNAAVVRKQTTTVYAEGGCNPLFNGVTVATVGQGRTKSKDCSGCLTSAILPDMNLLACHWRTGTRKPKSRSRRFGPFCESQGHIGLSLLPNYCEHMTVHDNVAVAVISEILPFVSQK